LKNFKIEDMMNYSSKWKIEGSLEELTIKIEKWITDAEKSIQDWTTKIKKLEKVLIKKKIEIKLEKYFIKQIMKIKELGGERKTVIEKLMKNFTEKMIRLTNIEELEEDDFFIKIAKEIESLMNNPIITMEEFEDSFFNFFTKQIEWLMKNSIKKWKS